MEEALRRTESGRASVIAVRAQDHGLIRQCPLDLAMNIASFQEIDPPLVREYFDDLRDVAGRRRLALYCCNREEKRLPDGTIIRFDDYPRLTRTN
jgi:hypothetical protein